MAQFDIGWRNVNQDIDPAFTRPQSYGGAIGSLSQALNTYADAKRAENTNSFLMQLAQAKTQGDIGNSQFDILGAIADKQGAVDGLGLLDALNAKRDDVTKRVALEQTQLGQREVNESILKGNTYKDFQSGVQTVLNDSTQEPSAEYLAVASNYIQDAKAKEAEANQQTFQNNLDSIKTAADVERVGNDGKRILLDTVKLGVEHPGGEKNDTVYDPETGTYKTVTTHTPGALELLGGIKGGGSAQVKIQPHHGEVAKASKSYGWSDNVTAGILGNFEVEGGYTGDKGDGGSANGIGQWRGGRVTNFQKVIGKSPTEATVEEQMRFVKWEFDNPASSGAFVYNKEDKLTPVQQRDAILNAKSPQKAAELFDKYYERSSGEHRSKRVAYANTFAGVGTSSNGSNSGALNNAVQNSNGTTTVTPKATKGNPTRPPITLNSALASTIPRIMPEYKAKVKEDTNARLASLDPVWLRQDFNNFLAENGAVKGKSAVGQSNNYTIYQAVENAKIPGYTGLSAEDKKKVLTSLFKWGENNPGIGMLGMHANTNAALIKKQVPSAIQQVLAVNLQAEKAKEIAYVRQQADTVYKDIKKNNPHATLDDAMQMVSPYHYNLIKNPPKSTKVSKPASTRIPPTLKRPNLKEDARFNLMNNPFQ